MTKEEVLEAMLALSNEDRGWVFAEVMVGPLRRFAERLDAVAKAERNQKDGRSS